MKIKPVAILALIVAVSAICGNFSLAAASELVASDEGREAYLYSVGENQFLVKFKGIEGSFMWNSLREPDMRVFDYDNDGEDEMAVSICVGSGTGFSAYDLHIVKVQNGGLAAYSYGSEDYTKHVNDAVSFRTVREKGRLIAEFASQNDRVRADVTDSLDEELLGDSEIKLECGDVANFVLGDDGTIKLTVGLGIFLYPNFADYYADLTANVTFADGKFTLSGIKIVTLDE